jgi:Lhr-like helicase
MPLTSFHPLIQQWFQSRFAAPTEPQRLGWPAILSGNDTLIAAPTGSGKTLTAFLAAIDRLFRLAERGELTDGIRVIYVSPLRALSNDMHRNLEEPLAEISALAAEAGLEIAPIRAGLRTGDTSARDRAAIIRRPPHILVTTPESLYLMLTGPKSREVLRTTETIIVDEIHALVRDKRGSHLSLSLERLAALCPRRLQRIGLSATQRPIEKIGAFLVGRGIAACRLPLADLKEDDSANFNRQSAIGNRQSPTIIDVGHQRDLDLNIEVPPSELGAVCMHEQWAEVNQRIVELINSHRSTLIFVNNRRLAERLTHQLSELMNDSQSENGRAGGVSPPVVDDEPLNRGANAPRSPEAIELVGSHHGSLSADIRLETERRLKSGELKAVVATSSLELGLDVGYIDLVIQIGSPRAIATFLQRVGRSGHALGKVPKGRLFALTRDELIECLALLRAVRAGRLDVVPIPEAPLDILAQQIVAEVACQEWNSDELFALFRQAYPYRNLRRTDFDRVVEFLSEGITPSAGRRQSRVYLHHDLVQRRLRTRPGARISATTSGGAIGEVASYRVVAEPERTVVGTLDEEFAAESMAGDIFLLGNTSWRIQNVRGGEVTVTDAGGAPPTIPFWRGEAPGRTVELSEEVSRLREELEVRVSDSVDRGSLVVDSELPSEVANSIHDPQSTIHDPRIDAVAWLTAETGVADFAVRQTVDYIAAQHGAIGLVPSQRRVVFERFFDESGGMQLVIHAPFGTRITRAWGLAMRKRFCRSFDFELQASADDDGIVLSLGPQHSFPLESMFGMLNSRNVQQLFEQAVLAVPTFQTRWRWNVTRALLVMRMEYGKKVPPPLQRFRADDLLTAVFPKLTGCQENITGDHELPDHPLIQQTMEDCLREANDIDGVRAVFERIERGEIELIARDTREPSPFCYELLNSNPYAFLDGGEAVERRARAVATRRSLTVESVQDLGWLDPEAIAQVRAEAQPLVRNADELHDALLSRIVLPADEGRDWTAWFDELVAQGRATVVSRVPHAISAGPESPGERQTSTSPSPPEGERGPGGEGQGIPSPQSEFRNTTLDNSKPIDDGVNFLSVIEATSRDTRPSPPTPLPLRGIGEVCAWVATERLPAALAAFPDVIASPPVTVPAEVRRDWDDVSARVAMLRGLLEVCGPITGEAAAERVGITVSQAEAALEALEGEGVVLRGRFERQPPDSAVNEDTLDSLLSPEGRGSVTSPSATLDPPSSTPSTVHRPPSTEWCHRRLLARIHRLTMEGLRRQIEPVTVDVFVRFLTRHHGVLPVSRRSGTNGLFEVIGMMQGLDIPAVAWERDILPGRLDKYQLEWLDELCLTGEVGWGRLFPPTNRDPEKSRPMASLTRVVPMSLFLRSDLDWLQSSAISPGAGDLSSPAREVFDLLQRDGALFATDLLNRTRMLPTQLNETLGELISRGLVTADGFSGLRSLLSVRQVSSGRDSRRDRQRAPRRRLSLTSAGRWSLWRRGMVDGGQWTVDGDRNVPSVASSPSISSPSTNHRPPSTEDWAWQLLRRWGVVFRDLLEREDGAPRWWELLQVYRRLEARGEIRGGRFITGVAGEQFALGDTVKQLRLLRDTGPRQELIVISAADPLNLVGILTPHDRVPSTASNRVAFLDGVPVAIYQGGNTTWLIELPKEIRIRLERCFEGLTIDATDHAESKLANPNAETPRSEPNTPVRPKPAASRTRPMRGIPRPRIS